MTKGQVLTKYYRWMNKNGGWVWMQTKASLIPHPTNPELKQMLCLNYIVRLAFVALDEDASNLVLASSTVVVLD